MEVSADHLFGVNGVEAGQNTSSYTFCRVTVQPGICEVSRFVLHQLVTPAVPWDPAILTHCFFIYKRLCRKMNRIKWLYFISTFADRTVLHYLDG